MKNRNNKGQFIKGYHPKTEFKKGLIPWNKGKKWPEIKKWLTPFKKGHPAWNKKEKIKKICLACGKEFFVIPALSSQRFCSRKCRATIILNGFKKGHKDFNNPKSIEKNRKVHLGKKLSNQAKTNIGKAKMGKRNPNWKNGVSSKNIRIRNSAKYMNWRIKVFVRDNYTCLNCGKRGGRLDVHHIQPFSNYPKLRFIIDNGVTLCRECHLLIPTSYEPTFISEGG